MLGCHHIRSRGSADHVFLDLHIWLDGATPLTDAHAVSHRVKDLLMERYPQIADAIIHIEPPPKVAGSQSAGQLAWLSHRSHLECRCDPFDIPRSSAALFHHADLADHHRLVERLQHVVDRERRDGDGGERFHLDAGARRGANARLDRVAVLLARDLDVDVRQRKRMAQRNQIGRALGGDDAGEARGLERIAFLHLPCANRAQRRGAHRDAPARHGLARGLGLVADIDHAHPAALITWDKSLRL